MGFWRKIPPVTLWWGVIVASWKFHENLLFNKWYFRREIIYSMHGEWSIAMFD